MQCHAMMCTNEAVAILHVRIPFRETIFNYEYPYCANDLAFFKAKMEEKYIVTQFDLEKKDA